MERRCRYRDGCGEEEYEALLKDVDGARITAWWPRAADITPAKGNKGVGVEKVLEYYPKLIKSKSNIPILNNFIIENHKGNL